METGIDVVGIEAHVKEIHGDTLLISSDSDDFPGAFAVTGADEMPEFSDLQGGTAIQIVMQRSDGTDEQGLAKYRAEKIVILSGMRKKRMRMFSFWRLPYLRFRTPCQVRWTKRSWRLEIIIGMWKTERKEQV